MSTPMFKSQDSSYVLGLLVLFLAQVLSAYMGIYVQTTYEKYGKHWAENLFYEHLLSLPLFLPLASSLRAQYQRLTLSPHLQVPHSVSSSLPPFITERLSKTPSSVFFLLMNSVTQLVCISGVNVLGAKSSAVTVTVVLNIRKLVSFVLSCWLFGNQLSGLMMVGSALVFGAGALYGWETSVGIKRRKARGKAGPSHQNGSTAEAKKSQ